jgi:hypothetical protein
MSEHNQQGAVKVVHGVLDTPKTYGIGDVSRRAHDEEIAQALVKHQLGRNPAVGAREDDGMGQTTLLLGTRATTSLSIAA